MGLGATAGQRSVPRGLCLQDTQSGPSCLLCESAFGGPALRVQGLTGRRGHVHLSMPGGPHPVSAATVLPPGDNERCALSCGQGEDSIFGRPACPRSFPTAQGLSALGGGRGNPSTSVAEDSETATLCDFRQRCNGRAAGVAPPVGPGAPHSTPRATAAAPSPCSGGWT